MAKGGRPTAFKPEFIAQAKKLCELGATDVEMAQFFKVATSTFYKWKNEFLEFSEALKAGKSASDDRVERSLYHKAVGYTFDSEKVFQNNGKIIRAKTVEHVPPDTTSMIFWLKNRRPDLWRDRQQLEHSGPNGKPIQVDHSDEQRARALAALAAKMRERVKK